MNAPNRYRTEFLVEWPLQGAALFRSPVSEIAFSDVYWRWIFDCLVEDGRRAGQRWPFVEIVEEGFVDPSYLVEKIPVSVDFVDAVRRIDVASAPVFDRVASARGSRVPTPELLLEEFERLLAEALPSGEMEMEID